MKILFSRVVVWFWIYVFRLRVKETLVRIENVFPENTRKQNFKILKESFLNSIMTLVELSYFPFSQKKIFKHTHVKGEEHLKRAKLKGRPVFLLTGHIGNGEIILYRVCAEGHKLKLIGKRVKNAFLDGALFYLRELSGLRHIPPRNALKGLIKALKEKSIVVFVNDQFTHPPGGVPTTFLGVPTYTNGAVARLALKFNAVVLPVNIYREKNHSTTVEFQEPVDCAHLAQGTDLEERIQRLTQAFNSELEKMIFQRPGQWMWVHRRWKVSPK